MILELSILHQKTINVPTTVASTRTFHHLDVDQANHKLYYFHNHIQAYHVTTNYHVEDFNINHINYKL
ncbi:hypothetical protein M7I_6371 [Glarea lozoyensis 74030]|uniref:Uncharacterized protein n=1 Tax=Glarea lozoyensis (strain ATCC 74030 / MF5533) TaxID=1104152 RepID=H0EUD7_GLAL7|nr:hypothetical protein M7I_6371 [Glarea lozoyensis 74030]